MNQPLDSGLRRAAMGILPSRRIQDFLSINDGEEEKSLVAIPMARLPLQANARLRPLPSFMDTPAWIQVVERQREQAAEVVPVPLLWRGARQGGVVELRLEPAAERSPGWTYSELPQ